jgi:hypothetical protein
LASLHHLYIIIIIINRYEFFKQWKKIKDDPALPPFIAVCALNENWGIFSTNFPNRTAGNKNSGSFCIIFIVVIIKVGVPVATKKKIK